MSKRQRAVISSAIFGILLGLIVWVPDPLFEYRYHMIVALTVISSALNVWSLKEGWKGVARLMTVLLPLMFAFGTGMFTFLVPEIIPGIWRWSWGVETGRMVGLAMRGFFWLFSVVAYYSLLLTMNIFSVSAIRTIALVRAASVSGFLLTLLSGFFVYNAIWSFRLPFYWNGLYVALVSFPLFLQGLWAAHLEDRLSWQNIFASVALALVMGEVALVLSFWPVSVAVASLGITTLLYVLLGIYQQWLMRRLFQNTIWEYTTFGLVVFGLVLLVTRWG